MTFEELLALATVVRDESTDEANTALRIGSLLLNIINKMSEIETTPGESPELRTSGEYVQTKLPSGVSWTNLYNKNVAFQKTSTHIQWKFGDGSWVDLVALTEITGSNGLSAYQIAVLNGFVGTPEEWLESLQGQDGSPDTASQIRDKINTLTGEDRLAVAILKDFVTAVLGQIQSNVPIANRKNFLLAGNQYSIASIADLSTSSIMSFETSAVHAGEFEIVSEELTDKVLKPIYHRLSILRQGRDKNWRKMYHTSEYLPAILVDPLVEAWGTKPDWLIIEGDPYLLGVANLNIMTATFYREYEVSTDVWEYDVVVMENKAIVGGNMDVAPPDLDTLILINFNQPESPIQSDSVQNLSFYGDILVPQVNNPLLGAQFDDLGSGNYAFTRTASTLNVADKANITIPVNLQSAELFRIREFTIIGRTRWIPDHGTDNDNSDIQAFGGNIDVANNAGFGFTRRKTAGLGRMRLRVYPGNSLQSFDSTAGDILRGDDFYGFACVFKYTPGSPGSRTVKMWLKSTMAGYPLTKVFDSTAALSLETTAYSALPINLDSHISGSATNRNVSQDELRFIRKAWEDSAVEAALNAIDP